MIVKEGGEFPKTVSALRKIPGIGEYTAGAIASIAFDEVSVFLAYFFLLLVLKTLRESLKRTISASGGSGPLQCTSKYVS